MDKYGFDAFNEKVIVPMTKGIGQLCYGLGDRILIDGLFVNGVGVTVRWFATRAKALQSGYLYHYATVMVAGLLILLCWLLLG